MVRSESISNFLIGVCILPFLNWDVFSGHDSTVFKQSITLQSDSICLTHHLFLWKRSFSIFSTFYTFLISPIVGRQLTDDEVSDAPNESLQRRMWLEVVDELMEILGKIPYWASKYLAYFLNCWNNTIIGRFKEFGYKNMWLTMADTLQPVS